MTAPSLLIFLLPALIGSFLIHLLWPERSGLALLLKVSLGVGAGLGLSSFLFFLSLLIAPGKINMLVVQTILLIALALAVIVRERGKKWPALKWPALSSLQWGLVGAVFLALIFAGLTFFNIYNARTQGAFDAWGIWNRAARFIYRDPENWRATTSASLYYLAHADYPLLVPLNVTWGWEILGSETPRLPMMQGLFFLLACVGVLFASVSLTKSLGQASLASLILMGTPMFLLTGAGQLSDVPVAYFMLSTCALIFLYFKSRQSSLLVLAGFMAGLGGWSKNEGLLLIAGSLAVLVVLTFNDKWKPLLWYIAGLTLPLVVILYFKIALVQPSELLAGGNNDRLAKILDLSRYWIILKHLGQEFLLFGNWPFSILIGLIVYAFVMNAGFPFNSMRGFYAVAAIIALQLLGYCAIFVITPYDLEWHIRTSLGRLALHVFPAGVFLLFSSITEPEKVFSRKGMNE